MLESCGKSVLYYGVFNVLWCLRSFYFSCDEKELLNKNLEGRIVINILIFL